MPRREDERHLNLAGKHPAACTCQDCTDKLQNKMLAKANKPSKNQKKKKKGAVQETVKRHPVGCTCPSCSLLGSIDFSGTGSQPDGGEKPGFMNKLFGKK